MLKRMSLVMFLVSLVVPSYTMAAYELKDQSLVVDSAAIFIALAANGFGADATKIWSKLRIQYVDELRSIHNQPSMSSIDTARMVYLMNCISNEFHECYHFEFNPDVEWVDPK